MKKIILNEYKRKDIQVVPFGVDLDLYDYRNKNHKNFNLDSTSYFSEEVKKYAYMWRDGGQFSKSYFKKN